MMFFEVVTNRRSLVKPGDLVRNKVGGFWGVPMTGIIIRESDRSNTWGDEKHQWWTVLCEGGVVVDEVETMMEVIDENSSGR
jgi:hypothetical protein